MCLDINECNNSPSPCAEVCTNNNGSYTCSCTDNSRTVTADGDCVGNEYYVFIRNQYYNVCMLQMLMSVPLLEDVNTIVAIELVDSFVHVAKDID